MAHLLSGAPLVSIPSIALFLVVTPSSSFAIHLSRTQALAPKSALPSSTFSSNVRSGRQVDGLLHHEAQVKRLRKAGYLSKDIQHRLPEEGKLLPTPGPHERVVFLPHFLRG